MVLGNPWSLTTSLKNKIANLVASLLLLHVMKCVIFKTTTITESCVLYVLGSPKTKSMLTSSQGLSGVDNGVYNPVLWLLPLASLQHSTNFLTSLLISSWKYLFYTNDVVFSMPKCPPIPPPCSSLIRFNLIDPWGMHNC